MSPNSTKSAGKIHHHLKTSNTDKNALKKLLHFLTFVYLLSTVIETVKNNNIMVGPGEHWFQGKLEFMLSQRGKPLLVHDGHTFGIQYVRKDKKYWQCNLSRKYNCKARVTTTDIGDIIVTNNEHCHTEIRQHLRKDYQRHKVMMNALINLSTNRLAVENLRRHNVNSIASNLQTMVAEAANSGSPLALQPHAAAAAASAMAGTLLDLGKRSATLDNDEQLKLNHHQSQQQPRPQHLQQDHRNLDMDDGESPDEQPLDCGVRSTIDRDHFDHDTRHFKQEAMESYRSTSALHQIQHAESSTNNNNNNESAEWQCKNEAVQQ